MVLDRERLHLDFLRTVQSSEPSGTLTNAFVHIQGGTQTMLVLEE